MDPYNNGRTGHGSAFEMLILDLDPAVINSTKRSLKKIIKIYV